MAIEKEEKPERYKKVIETATETIGRRIGIKFSEKEENWTFENRTFNSSLDSFLLLFSNFRKSVLEILSSSKPSFFKDLLSLCDSLRDQHLAPFGVRMEDDR